MNNLFATMLAGSEQAEAYGVALNPKLKQALEAELRFPTKSAGPIAQEVGDHPDVLRFPVPATDATRRQA